MIFKRIFIILQIYFLLLNTVFANSEQNYQRHLDGVFSSVSASIMKTMFAELVKMQSDPLKNLVQFQEKKIRDYHKIYEQVKTYENDIKNLKVTSKNDRIQISYKNEIFLISEIWLDGSFVLNGQKIIWDPEIDTLEDIKHQINFKKNQSLIHLIFPTAYADPISFMLMGMVVTLAALVILNLFLNKAAFDEAQNKLNKVMVSLRGSIEKCENDLNDSNLLIEKDQMMDSYKNETLKFINFIEDFESPQLYKRMKKVTMFGCEVLENRTKLWAKYESIINKLKESCTLAKSLELCLAKHKDLKLNGKKITDLNRDNKKTIEPDSSYFDLYESIESGNKVKQQ